MIPFLALASSHSQSLGRIQKMEPPTLDSNTLIVCVLINPKEDLHFGSSQGFGELWQADDARLHELVTGSLQDGQAVKDHRPGFGRPKME